MTKLYKMADRDPDEPVDIQSRIKLFSNNLDLNFNVTNSRPNPTPRKKSETKSPILNKPKLPIKPQPTPRSPKSNEKSFDVGNISPGKSSKPRHKSLSRLPKTKPLPTPKTNVETTSPINQNIKLFENTKNPNPNDSNNVKNNKIAAKTVSAFDGKPKPPAKPVVLKYSLDTSVNSTQSIFNINNNKAISQETSTDINSPPKPPRGKHRKSLQSKYENHDIKSLKTRDDSAIMKRCDTLDAIPRHASTARCKSVPIQSNYIIPPTVPPHKRKLRSQDADGEYEYPFEQQRQQQRQYQQRLHSNRPSPQVYEQPAPQPVKDFRDSLSNEDSEIYEDPDTVNFEAPSRPFPPQHVDTSGDEANYEEPSDADYELPPDSGFKMFTPKDTSSKNVLQREHAPLQSNANETPPRVPPHLGKRHSPNDTKKDFSDDENDYELPDGCPPPVPRHNRPPPVPEHACNNLQSSSDDDESTCPDYTDPELDLYRPPVPIPQGRRANSARRGGYNTPADYIPNIDKLMPGIKEDDEFLHNTQYVDPEKVFTNGPNIGIVSKKTENDEEMYTDEPLYQVYSHEKNEAEHRASKKKDDVVNDDTEDPVDLATKVGSVRLLWSELPTVRSSGIMRTVSSEERKRQEAMFEVITSEASYLKSLDILVNHFMLHPLFLPNPNLPSENTDEHQLIDRQQYHFLFSGISAVKAVSERFLKDLRRRQQESIKISTISDIILEYAEKHFGCYVKYCSNQVFQDRTLTALTHNSRFSHILSELEADPICQSLTMHSFLTLPMQRITRLPLLVDAICNRCSPGSDEFNATDAALTAVNKLKDLDIWGKVFKSRLSKAAKFYLAHSGILCPICTYDWCKFSFSIQVEVVHESNEGARKMERTEEMYYIQKTMTFKTKPIPLISTSRWLVKKGDIMCLHEDGRFSKYKNQLRQIFKGKSKRIYLFLFTDLLLVTKMKGEEQFKVIDYCQRSLLKTEILTHIPDPEPPKYGTLGTLNINPLRYAFTLVLLENSNGKTVDYHCFLPTETEKTRWMDAFNPKPLSTPGVEGESIYEEWDCPQNQVIYPYQAQQSDELTLIEGDIIHVLRKLPDGWAEGQRLRDGEKGWFPINHTDEIDSKHARAKNLMQRYRLLTHSQTIVNQLIGNI